jgi:hypothetical protein
MTQHEELLALVKGMNPDETEALAKKLSEVLVRAQNRPPLGVSDMSVDSKTFDDFKRLERSLWKLAQSIREAQSSAHPEEK